jgi:PPM family protein phosphatase
MSSEDHLATERRRALSPILTTDAANPLASRVGVDWSACSHAGRIRSINQDHYLILRQARSQKTLATSLPRADLPGAYDEYGYGAVVADGLGEDGPGAVASRVAISTLAHLMLHFGRWNLRVDDSSVAAEINERAEFFYRRVDEAVIQRSRTEPELTGMTTTLTAAFTAGDDLFLAHVGHSRAYLFRDGSLTQLTRDHTLERRLVETARPSPVPVHPAAQDLRHILTDTIGGGQSLGPVDIDHLRLLDGDALLLCTDGLTDLVGEGLIAEIVALRRSSQEQCKALVDLALNAGGTDNVTVLLGQYEIPDV